MRTFCSIEFNESTSEAFCLPACSILPDKKQSTTNPSDMSAQPPTPDMLEAMLAETFLTDRRSAWSFLTCSVLAIVRAAQSSTTSCSGPSSSPAARVEELLLLRSNSSPEARLLSSPHVVAELRLPETFSSHSNSLQQGSQYTGRTQQGGPPHEKKRRGAFPQMPPDAIRRCSTTWGLSATGDPVIITVILLILVSFA